MHLRNLVNEEAFAAGDCARENLGRLRAASLAVLLINVVQMLWFDLSEATLDPQQASWRDGVLFVHMASGVLCALLALLAHRSLHRPQRRLQDQVLVATGITGMALLAVSLAVIDQWTTPSITPFVIGTTAISSIFLIRPQHAIVLFSCLLVIGCVGMTMTQPVDAIVLSNQGNMFAATIIAIFLAILLWHNHTTNLLLQRALHLNRESLELKQAQLEALAQNDPLTGLFNRREFSRLARRELIRAARHDSVTVLVLVDLDRFKEINDTYGHPVGDDVLQNVAHVLLDGLRKSDVVSRFGGDEFMLLLPQTNEVAAIALVNRLRENLGQAQVLSNGKAIRVTASFGVAVVAPGTMASLEQTYLAADGVLYLAKKRGRDRVESTSVQIQDYPH
jgi:diguanylate cyclase (GGDEF)-like protein